VSPSVSCSLSSPQRPFADAGFPFPPAGAGWYYRLAVHLVVVLVLRHKGVSRPGGCSFLLDFRLKVRLSKHDAYLCLVPYHDCVFGTHSTCDATAMTVVSVVVVVVVDCCCIVVTSTSKT
jgi:hypothetical protein